MKTYTPDEQKCRNILHAKRGESMLDALQRHMTYHKKTKGLLSEIRKANRSTAWHNCMTIQRVAHKAGVCHRTVTDDIARGLITPDRKEKISGRLCNVFTNSEVKGYVEYRKTLTGKNRGFRWEKIIKSANTVGVEETARLFNMKAYNVRKTLERHKVKLIPLEDIQASAKTVHRVAM